MRITNQMVHFGAIADYQKSASEFYKLNKQSSSGLKIQHSYEDSGVYTDASRLEYEVATLEQVEAAGNQAVHFASNADKALSDFTNKLTEFKSKLIRAANDIHDVTSRNAIANDMQGLRNHLFNIANTSINGQFLFSGTALDTRPVDEAGNYHGNSEQMRAVIGSKIKMPYNVTGQDLILGQDNDYKKILTTNVRLIDNKKINTNDLRNATTPSNFVRAADEVKYINAKSQVMDLVGIFYRTDEATRAINPINNKPIGFMDPEKDYNEPQNLPKTTFYIQGKKPNGEAFRRKFEASADASMQSILDKIGEFFGNDSLGKNKVVNVELNPEGQINITDLTPGNNKMQFHILAATNRMNADGSTNQYTDSNGLNQPNPSNQAKIEDVYGAQKDGLVHITEFVSSNFKTTNGLKANPGEYDHLLFDKKSNKLMSNIEQITRDKNTYATDDTKLSEVASVRGLSEDGLYNISGKKIAMDVKSLDGKNYEVVVDFNQIRDPQSQFIIKDKATGDLVLESGIYNGVYNATNNTLEPEKTAAQDVTYKQLNDVISMVASGKIPTYDQNDTDQVKFEKYMDSIKKARDSVHVGLDYRGRINIEDKISSKTEIEFAMYDPNSKDYNLTNTPPTFSFMANNAFAIDEPSVDIFKDLDMMIEAVRGGYYRADSNKTNPRNPGIQGALKRVEHILDHVSKEQGKIGSYTNSLKEASHRATLLRVNVETIKTDIIGADIGEVILKLKQQLMSQEAMLHASSKISKLSLLNYM